MTDRNIYTGLNRPPQTSHQFILSNMKAIEEVLSHLDGSYDCPEVTPLLALQGLDLGTEGANLDIWQLLSHDARLKDPWYTVVCLWNPRRVYRVAVWLGFVQGYLCKQPQACAVLAILWDDSIYLVDLVSNRIYKHRWCCKSCGC